MKIFPYFFIVCFFTAFTTKSAIPEKSNYPDLQKIAAFKDIIKDLDEEQLKVFMQYQKYEYKKSIEIKDTIIMCSVFVGVVTTLSFFIYLGTRPNKK